MMNLSQSVWKPTKTNKHENTIENMISFIISILVLIISYYTYGKLVENVFGVQERRVDNLKPLQNSHTPKQTPPIKGITKNPVRSMMIVVYNEFAMVPTLWDWAYI